MLIEVFCDAPQGVDHSRCSRKTAESHSWTVTSFTEVGKGREEDGAQVATFPQNPRQPLGPSRSQSSKTPMPTYEGRPRVSRDPNQVVSEAQSRVVKLEAAIIPLGENDPLREELQRVRFRSSLYGPKVFGGHGQIG